jgi:hypothetical protein
MTVEPTLLKVGRVLKPDGFLGALWSGNEPAWDDGGDPNDFGLSYIYAMYKRPKWLWASPTRTTGITRERRVTSSQAGPTCTGQLGRRQTWRLLA